MSGPGTGTRDGGSAEETLERALGAAASTLAGASSVALACHVNPDPDAIGSMLGLADVLRSLGVEVVCSWPNEPLERPRWLSLFADGELPPIVGPREFPRSPSAMVALDTASPDRLGMLAPSAERAAATIVLDHHVTNEGFGTVRVIDPRASSTCELVVRLAERMDARLTDVAAACLYAGLVADTGRFQYEASRPETLRVGALLREGSFDHARLSQLLFEDNSFRYLRVLALALDRAELLAADGLVWTYLTQADLERLSVTMPETDDLIEVVRTAREADVSCVLKQQRDGRFKVSLRSRGATDVGSIAQANGGGGHRLAAGYTSQTGPADTVASVVVALRAQRGT